MNILSVWQIINKVLANWTQQHIKKIVHDDQVGFIPRRQGWFNIHKSTNIISTNRIRNKNYAFISIDAQKAFDKIQHSFMIKNSKETSRRNVPPHNKGCLWQSYSQHHTKWEKADTISSKVRTKRVRCPFSPLLFNIVLEFLTRIIRQEKEIKKNISRKESKLSQFADDMIL
jgi:hypothetical protein